MCSSIVRASGNNARQCVVSARLPPSPELCCGRTRKFSGCPRTSATAWARGRDGETTHNNKQYFPPPHLSLGYSSEIREHEQARARRAESRVRGSRCYGNAHFCELMPSMVRIILSLSSSSNLLLCDLDLGATGRTVLANRGRYTCTAPAHVAKVGGDCCRPPAPWRSSIVAATATVAQVPHSHQFLACFFLEKLLVRGFTPDFQCCNVICERVGNANQLLLFVQTESPKELPLN